MDPVDHTGIILVDASEFVAEILTIHPKDGSEESENLAKAGIYIH